MQVCSEGCKNIVWDLTNVESWEHLLPGEPYSLRGVLDNEDPEVDLEREKHLDMPLSYVKNIEISRESKIEDNNYGTKDVVLSLNVCLHFRLQKTLSKR